MLGLSCLLGIHVVVFELGLSQPKMGGNCVKGWTCGSIKAFIDETTIMKVRGNWNDICWGARREVRFTRFNKYMGVKQLT